MLYKVKGLRLVNHKGSKSKQEVVVSAVSKQDIWNNPSNFGFLKIFRVTQVT